MVFGLYTEYMEIWDELQGLLVSSLVEGDCGKMVFRLTAHCYFSKDKHGTTRFRLAGPHV